MVFKSEFWIIIAAVALICAYGFKKYLWFITNGYGLSISAIGICLMAIYNDSLDVVKVVGCVLMIIYGFRLSGFLILRELKSITYNKKMETEISDGSKVSFVAKFAIFASCVLLYIMMCAPVIYRFSNGLPGDSCMVIGLTIMLLGIILEAASDIQKSSQKKKNPRRFCNKGLFRLVRCPNYLGELIIWTGVLISGFTALQSVGQWIVVIVGYLGIVYIMFSGARRLELRQERTYGSDPEYRQYVKTTPILLPFIPLYSVKKHKWLVA